ncbi:hypothetical protein ACLOJK_017636 [Asimina triloba]
MTTAFPISPNLLAEQPIKTAQRRQHHSSSQRNPHPSVSLIEICRSQKSELLQLHSHLIKTNLIKQTQAFSSLFLSFALLPNSAGLGHAQKLFDSDSCRKTTFVYNNLIRAYNYSWDPRKALVLFLEMIREDSCQPDDFTFTFVLSACAKLRAVSEGKQTHAQMVKNPCRIRTNSRNALMGFYVKTDDVGFGFRHLFDEIAEPDIVSWNCLLDGYVKLGDLDKARRVFEEIPERDVFSWTMMMVGYANAGLMSEARYLFNWAPWRNVVSWSALINGYVRLGQYREAFYLFNEMQAVEVKADKVMLTTLLSACASLGALDQGRWFHAYIGKHGIEVDAHLATALVDMYGKCGKIDAAVGVFRATLDKKVFLWNSILGGLAMHSQGQRAVELFGEMLESGIKPNEITFICVLSACSHSGLVDDGLRIFNSMVMDHGLVPTVEHYGCVVDLLGRAGLLAYAEQIIENMPMGADGNIWRALLGACRIHGDAEMGEHVGRSLIDLEPLNDANYVLLSNVYAFSKRWEDVTELRRTMKARGVRKVPGCSSIELNGVVHEFVAGDRSHPQTLEIYLMLDNIENELPSACWTMRR